MPDTKPQTLKERIWEKYPGSGMVDMLSRRGAEFGAREVLSAPVSDAVVEAACGRQGMSWAYECALMGQAWAYERRKWMRATIAAALRAIAKEQDVNLDG